MDLQKIKSQVISIILNRGLIAFFSLLLEVVFIKYLTVEEKGEIFYIRSNIELFAYIFTFGLGMSIVHFRSKYGSKYDGQIVKWIFFSFLSLTIGSIIFYNTDMVVKYLFIDREFFIPASIGSIFALASFYLQKIYLSDDNLKLHNQVIFYSKVVVALVLLLIALFVDNNKIYYLVVSIPVSLFLVNAYFIRKLRLNFFSKEKSHYFFNFNVNIYLYELLYQLKTKFDNFLVLYFLGVSAVGIFSVAVNFGALVLIVSSSVSLILLKEMSSSIDKMHNSDVISLFKKYTLMMFLITLFSIVFVYIVVHFFGQERFEESFYVYCLYSINLFLFSIVTFFQSYFSSKKQTNLQLYSLLISVIPYLILFLFPINDLFQLVLIMIISNMLQCMFLFFKRV